MRKTARSASFAWWATPTKRDWSLAAPAAIAAPARRPFSKPIRPAQPGSESAFKTAQIFRFTGSNTPYESHE